METLKLHKKVHHHYQNNFKKINKAKANGTICGLPSLSDISHLLKKYQGEREKMFQNSATHNFKMDRTPTICKTRVFQSFADTDHKDSFCKR